MGAVPVDFEVPSFCLLKVKFPTPSTSMRAGSVAKNATRMGQPDALPAFRAEFRVRWLPCSVSQVTHFDYVRPHVGSGTV
jgi:hypothetical protein